MEQILNYFDDLSENQIEKFNKLQDLYNHWNDKINVISRKDMDFFYEKHVLHSLSIAKIIKFKPNTKILDIGTGGGFPGIPLAILFPECSFYLVDSIGKKISVVNEVIKELDLKNVKTEVIRAEKLENKFDFIVSRAVTKMEDFTKWTTNLYNKKSQNDLKNGILYLKGGDLSEELKSFPKAKIFNLSAYYLEPFFETKKVVYLEK